MSKRIRWGVSLIVAVVMMALLVSKGVAAELPAQPDRVGVGQEAPLFELEDLDGERTSLEGLRGEAPLVLIFFRGTW